MFQLSVSAVPNGYRAEIWVRGIKWSIDSKGLWATAEATKAETAIRRAFKESEARLEEDTLQLRKRITKRRERASRRKGKK